MNQQKHRITNINIKGFKSIDTEGQNIPLGDINVLIGANGVGKSNLISFFEMLEAISNKQLQSYIIKNGGSQTLLHYGAKNTQQINCQIEFYDNDTYRFDLCQKNGSSLFFETEEYKRLDNTDTYISQNTEESVVNEMFKTNRNLKNGFIDNFDIFQFSDTSINSKIRNSGYINDGRKLHSDGGNLAAFLYGLKNNITNKKYYDRIIKYIKMAMPQFSDFELLPSLNNENYIMLDWYETNSEYLFGPHQISDGSLRFMALASLLLQPPKTLPSLIILDEPELGLHPSAISLFASMVNIASQNCQIIIATQSTSLIDEFEAKDIIVVERENNRSIFKKLNINEMNDWLQEYSLSEIWEKNIIGGRP